MELLSLAEAADQLGVHPGTLRRWADHGDIAVLRTPGGHRRFAQHDLEQFVQAQRESRLLLPMERMWAEQALSKTRQELSHRGEERWLVAHGEADRQRHRQMGRRLLGLLMQYIAQDDGEEVLHEARATGRTYAQDAVALGIPLSEALRAMLFFRDLLVETAMQLPETAHCRPESSYHLLQRINTLLNAVHLSMAEVYEKA